MNYLIEYNNNIIGVYNDYNLAILFINSCMQNKFIVNNVNILTFNENSCYCINKETITNKNQILENDNEKTINIQNQILENDNEKTINIQNQILENDNEKTINIDQLEKEKNKINSELHDINHKLNLYKKYKEQIENEKNKFQVDIELYKKFNENLKNDSNFIIPELFINKYNIMYKLDILGELNYDNFIKNYQVDNNHNEFKELFN